MYNPFYKTYMDGTLGIRVEDHSDVLMDPYTDNSADVDQSFQIGCSVRIDGLKVRLDLNGTSGTVQKILKNGRRSRFIPWASLLK